MGYANPVEAYDFKRGADAFVRDAAAAGIDGILIVDYPPEECVDFAAKLRAHHMDLIFLLAPTSTPERMAQVARVASGYVYYVSLKGVTGSGALDIDAVDCYDDVVDLYLASARRLAACDHVGDQHATRALARAVLEADAKILKLETERPAAIELEAVLVRQ
jgi:hypothetical protein